MQEMSEKVKQELSDIIDCENMIADSSPVSIEYFKKNWEITFENFQERLNWYTVAKDYQLSEEFIMTFKKYLKSWKTLCENQVFSEDFILNFGYTNSLLSSISHNQKMSENLIRKLKDKVNWGDISCRQKLSEDFIREFKDYVDWSDISHIQKLSENFIREFKDYVNWRIICKYQKLSEKFILEMKDKIDFIELANYQRLSEKFVEDFSNANPDCQLKKTNELNWMYKSKEFKLKEVKETGLFEIVDDKVIAYKGTRFNGCSMINFQYQFEVGKEYEAFCDCRSWDSVSFGLHAGTLNHARMFCGNKRVFKVEIDIDDLGCIVDSEYMTGMGGKEDKMIRCSKLKVLEEIPRLKGSVPISRYGLFNYGLNEKE